MPLIIINIQDGRRHFGFPFNAVTAQASGAEDSSLQSAVGQNLEQEIRAVILPDVARAVEIALSDQRVSPADRSCFYPRFDRKALRREIQSSQIVFRLDKRPR